MRIQTIQNWQVVKNNYYNTDNKEKSSPQSQCNKSELQNNFYFPLNINFKGEAQLEGLKKIFSYGLPCMYTGVEMLDSKVALKFLNSLYRLSAETVFEFLEKWEKSFLHPEFTTESAKESYFIIKEQAKKMPDSTIKDVLQSLKPEYEKELIKQQLGILNTLEAYSYSLPEKYVQDYKKLLENNNNRIMKKPVTLDFSVKEFQYKLEQIKNEYATMRDRNSVSIINTILKESKNFHQKTSPQNTSKQRKTLIKLEGILNRSHLNRDEALRNLFDDSRLRLNNKKTMIPFSKKAFLYDLGELIADLPDKDLKRVIMTIATKLPTSGDSSTSFIIKFASKTPDKLIYNYLWPIIATIEHIWPKSIGGPRTDISNCGGAAAKINSNRSNSLFVEQIKRKPMTGVYTQKQIDRLIKYALNGIFEKENVPVSYIEGYKDTVLKRSKGQIVLDTSELYKTGKFQKPELALE